MKENSELFRLSFKALISVKESVSVEDMFLRSVRGELKHPQELLVLGWWNLVSFQRSIYKPMNRCPRALFLFVVPHSGVFRWVTMILLNSLLF